MTTKWHEGRLVAADTETTGTDPHTARVVTAAIVHLEPGQRPRTIQWVIHPGVDVPDEAAAVHGWTTERLDQVLGGPGRAVRVTQDSKQTMTADGALFEIAMHVGSAIGREVPLVVHNAAYDLTLLEAEFARNDIDQLAARPQGVRGVVDPMVIEKQFDPYRKVCYRKGPGGTCDREAGVHHCSGCKGGKWVCRGCGAHDRKLGSLCRHYGVVHAGEHGAHTDAIAAARLAVKLAGAWPEIARWKLGTLHEHQVSWRREQSDSLREFWRGQGDERWREVSSDWPVQQVPVAPGVS